MVSRPQLVLLPGLLCDEALWAHQAAALADMAEIHVADLSRDSTVEDMAARVLALAPARFALAGLSMGGYVAQAIMRAAPERVERLALADTNARADSPEQTERRQALIRQTRIGQFRGVTKRLLPMLIHPDRLDDRHLVSAVTGMAERIGKDAFLRQQAAIMARPDNRARLRDIRCPALVLCGRQDQLTPPALHREMADAVPGAALVVVENCGHLAPLERPEAVSALLRYWLQV
ncbi:MAG: alpha/beta fold hydrolase [Alphaproteobacteria bacterium]|nr:alpha/beta fold hydrolase [Alphaproteobacteria bacterium]